MRHPLHAMCPYFAMFPEDFVSKHLLAFTRPGDLVLDPFCGRGTTILEALLNNRRALGTDINPVAACVSGAKAEVPELTAVQKRLTQLQNLCDDTCIVLPKSEFFQYCYEEETLREICVLRKHLKWKSRPVDRFIAAVALGVLHGESHKSLNYLSNRMPRTISTKPEYSIRWWRDRSLIPERRPVFEVLARMSKYRLSDRNPGRGARVILADARDAGAEFIDYEGEVRLMITSPPYLDMTDYSEDQWLRLWFLGGKEYPVRRLSRDDRYRAKDNYWQFLTEAWTGCAKLLRKDAVVVIRIGGRKLSKDEIADGLRGSLERGTGRRVSAVNTPHSSLVRHGQVNSFRPGTRGSEEHDFVFRLGNTIRNRLASAIV